MTPEGAITFLKAEKSLNAYYVANYKESEASKAMDKAIKALERQIPKRIIEERWIDTKCECGKIFSEHRGDGYHSVPNKNKTNYCPNCGQRLVWEDYHAEG